VSVRSADNQRLRREPRLAEQQGVSLLAGVGNDLEWWIFSAAMIGHVRVGLTGDEHEAISSCALGPVLGDAGDSGPLRARRRPAGRG
jgi:hypothetical protein